MHCVSHCVSLALPYVLFCIAATQVSFTASYRQLTRTNYLPNEKRNLGCEWQNDTLS